MAPATGWFETVAEAQKRAKKHLPRSVYSALLAGSEKGVTVADNVAAFIMLRAGEGIARKVLGGAVERNTDLRLFLLLAARLRFGNMSDDLCILGNDNLAVCSFQVLRNFGLHHIANFYFLCVNPLRELHRIM